MENKPTLWGREPVAIVATVEAIIMLAIGFGLNITGEQVAMINTALMAVLALIARQQVTPMGKVLEYLPDLKNGHVVAGPANDMAVPGEVVREIGEEDEPVFPVDPETPDNPGRPDYPQDPHIHP